MEFLIPEPFEVTHWTAGPATENPSGQMVPGEPTPTPRRVRGFVPAGEQEIRAAQLAGRTIADLVMLTADGDWPTDSTVELWDGRKFEVNAPAADYNLGPFGFKPGYAIELRRVNDGPS
jgi:hypothetical protein